MGKAKNAVEKVIDQANDRERMARAVGAVLLDHAWSFRVNENKLRALEALADELPTIAVLEQIESLRAEEAARIREQAKRLERYRKPKAKKATPAKSNGAALKRREGFGPMKEAAETKPKPGRSVASEAALAYLASAGAPMSMPNIAVAVKGARSLVALLVKTGKVVATGKGKATRYSLPNGAAKQMEIPAT